MEGRGPRQTRRGPPLGGRSKEAMCRHSRSRRRLPCRTNSMGRLAMATCLHSHNRCQPAPRHRSPVRQPRRRRPFAAMGQGHRRHQKQGRDAARSVALIYTVVLDCSPPGGLLLLSATVLHFSHSDHAWQKRHGIVLVELPLLPHAILGVHGGCGAQNTHSAPHKATSGIEIVTQCVKSINALNPSMR